MRKAVVPELTELANYFEKDEPNFPEELMKQKAKSVRDTIRAIEANEGNTGADSAKILGFITGIFCPLIFCPIAHLTKN